MTNEIEVGGVYRHYKRGGTYEVIGLGMNSETDEPVVIYKALYADKEFPIGQLWVRTIASFTSEVEHGGKSVPRFALLND